MIDILEGLFKVFNNKEKIKFIFTVILIFLSLILETIGISLILPLINILILKKTNNLKTLKLNNTPKHL